MSAAVGDIGVAAPAAPASVGEHPKDLSSVPAHHTGRFVAPDDKGLSGDVRAVTGAAGHSLSLVEVGVMKIPLSPPEAGCSRRELVGGKRRVVTFPAEGVLVVTIPGVERGGECLDEQAGPGSAVRVVAGETIAVAEGPVGACR